MLRMGLNALVGMDFDLARLVVQMDDKVHNIMQAACKPGRVDKSRHLK